MNNYFEDFIKDKTSAFPQRHPVALSTAMEKESMEDLMRLMSSQQKALLWDFI